MRVSIRIIEIFVRVVESGSFVAAARTLLIDPAAVSRAINGLEQRGVTVVTLVSDVPGSKRQHYAGIDNTSAGRTAASLMGKFLGSRHGEVGLIAGSLALRDHIERQFGFEQIMAHEFQHLEILPVREARDDWQRVEEITTQLLREHPNLIGLYNVGAGTRGIVSALEKAGRDSEVVFIARHVVVDSAVVARRVAAHQRIVAALGVAAHVAALDLAPPGSLRHQHGLLTLSRRLVLGSGLAGPRFAGRLGGGRLGGLAGPRLASRLLRRGRLGHLGRRLLWIGFGLHSC